MNESSPYLKLSSKTKRKFKNVDKENNNKMRSDEHSLPNKVKRLRLGTLSGNTLESQTSYTNALVQAANSFSKCLFNSSGSVSSPAKPQQQQHFLSKSSLVNIEGSSDSCSHDSGFGNLSPFRCEEDEEEFVCDSNRLDMSSNSIEQMDELNSYCIENSLKINRCLDISNCSQASNSSLLAARRCLFKSSPLAGLKSNITTPNVNKVLFGDDSAHSKHASRQVTPVSIHRQHGIIINESEAATYSTFEEQAISSIEKMFEMSSTVKTTSLHSQHMQIMQSLDMECEQSNAVHVEASLTTTTCTNSRLIGDRSSCHILPTKTNIKHNDLNVITPSTLNKVLNGEYDSQIDSLVIIDSRYPYEYEGGHINKAANVYTKEKIMEMFFQDEKLKAANERANKIGKRFVIVFHCEFSSERGPGLLRFLRNQDRDLNKDKYPHLFYPELYLLEGGYKAFYEENKLFCEPQTYKPMLHEDHVQDLKHFRAKTKTWNRFTSNCSSATKNGFKSRLQRFPRSTLF